MNISTDSRVAPVLELLLCYLSNISALIYMSPTQLFDFPFEEEKLVASLIAIPNVDKANRRQEKGKKLN